MIGLTTITFAAALLYEAFVFGTVAILVLRKREPSAVYGWALAILFLPVVGMVAFYTFGLTRLPSRLQKRVRHTESFQARFSLQREEANGDSVGATSPFDQIAALVETLSDVRMQPGNDVECLHEGAHVFERIFDAIDRAQHHIHLEKYIFRDDHLGRALIQRLVAKARSGIEVRVLVDAYGSLGGKKLLRELRRNGGRGEVFLPFLPGPKRLTPNLRNHRKVLVVDGKVGFLGGLNVGDEYLGKGRAVRNWFDAHLRVEGPAVLDIQEVFVQDWDFTTKELLEGEHYFPATVPCGPHALQVAASGPDQRNNAFFQCLLAAIALSHDELLIASPYVVPPESVRSALMNAALRGVRVRVLTQGYPPDHFLPYWCARFYWEDLFRAGVEVSEYQRGMMHAKAVIVDSGWGLVGSPNLDSRSLGLNFEIFGMTTSAGLVRTIRTGLLQAFDDSMLVVPGAFRSRPRYQRLIEEFAHLFAPLL